MKYLLFASLVFCLEGLSPDDITLEQSPDECFNSSVPKFTSALYSASIDVVGHHMSGLLFLKTMPDSSQRAVFSNEAGVTYFDFEWKKNGEFRVHRVIKKLKKKIVLNTLKKDFELVLVPPSIVLNSPCGLPTYTVDAFAGSTAIESAYHPAPEYA